ncbi:hypothetical protein [Pseudonocardia sp.]|uniref:hypothetical protein n=1 Tax=Pseudonocardia sp. TaxID=60912 RepID=UPI0031FCF25C
MTAPRDPEDQPGFDVVRRGYDRAQVESHVQELRRRVVAAENARRMAEQHAAAAADELAVARDRSRAAAVPAAQETFGVRAERVLRLAEREAAEIRARAAHEAAALLEEAHRAAGEAGAVAERERAAAQRAREDVRALDEDVALRTRDLHALRTGLRDELARVHSALGGELRQLESEIQLAQQVPVPRSAEAESATPGAPGRPTGPGDAAEAETVPAEAVPEVRGAAADATPSEVAPAEEAPTEPRPATVGPAEDTVWAVPGHPTPDEATATGPSTDTGPVPAPTVPVAGTGAAEEPAAAPVAEETADEGEPGTVDLFAEGPKSAEVTGRIPLPRPHDEQPAEPGRHAFRS